MEKLDEVLKTYIETCHLNFLIGSGMSRPYLSTLGNIETLITAIESRDDVGQEIQKIIKSSLYKKYLCDVMLPNITINNRPDYEETLGNYKKFIENLNQILLLRHNTLVSKQINLFTTNIDLFHEQAIEEIGVECNDGFKGRIKPTYDLSNFQKSFVRHSLHFDNVSEIPSFNLLKIHGSISWEKDEGECIRFTSAMPILDKLEKYISANQDSFIEIASDEGIDALVLKANAISSTTTLDEFNELYEQLLVVNPTKGKFKETVLDQTYYELMRIFSNSLEKENSLLIVMGFSFADEHIRSLLIRAVNANPTLKVFIFAHSDTAKSDIQKNLEAGGNSRNNNISIELAPSGNYDFGSINHLVFDQIIAKLRNPNKK